MKKILILTLFYVFSTYANDKVIFKSGIKLIKTSQSISVTLEGKDKIPDTYFTELWPHHPYPVASYKIDIPLENCSSLLSCHSLKYLKISETHVTGHKYTRYAKFSYSINHTSNEIRFEVYFEAENGKSLSYEFLYQLDDLQEE